MSPDAFRTPMEITWQFDYAIGIERLRSLYSKSKRQQWDAEREIDWSLPIDPARPIIEEEAEFFEVTPETLWQADAEGRLAASPWADLLDEIRRRSGKPFVGHGLGLSPGTASTSAQDEARLARLEPGQGERERQTHREGQGRDQQNRERGAQQGRQRGQPFLGVSEQNERAERQRKGAEAEEGGRAGLHREGLLGCRGLGGEPLPATPVGRAPARYVLTAEPSRGSARSISARRGSSQGGRMSRSPRVSVGSSTAKPGPSVATSKRAPPGSRK